MHALQNLLINCQHGCSHLLQERPSMAITTGLPPARSHLSIPRGDFCCWPRAKELSSRRDGENSAGRHVTLATGLASLHPQSQMRREELEGSWPLGSGSERNPISGLGHLDLQLGHLPLQKPGKALRQDPPSRTGPETASSNATTSKHP